MLTLTRRYTFSAGHRLCRSGWSDARNVEVYGRCANAAGHGHNYVLYVTVTGPLDAETGMVADLRDLDDAVEREVIARLDHRFLNHEVAEFRDTVPTSENLCGQIGRWLAARLAPARLVRITLYETDTNCFELVLPPFAAPEP